MRRKSIAPFVGLCLLASAVPAAHAEDPPAPVASSRAQATDRGPSAKARHPRRSRGARSRGAADDGRSDAGVRDVGRAQPGAARRPG